MKSVIILLVTALFASATIHAQSITGTVKDSENNNQSGSSVLLLNKQDSSVVKINATNKEGKYLFENISEGSYLIKVSHVGYSTSFSEPFNLKNSDLSLKPVVLKKHSTQLGEVTVSAKRPLVELKADKMIVNVEGTINATGNDGIDLLRRSPGVMVDKDDKISMAGKNGVKVYIDGRPSPLSGTDLGNYLRSLQSSGIEKIELITNPSARYEAEGNAGIINIVLKKNKSFGTNGTVTAGYNIGKYAKYNGGFTLNHRSKKTNVYGSYNIGHGNNFGKLDLYREVEDSIFDQHSFSKRGFTNHNIKAGVDFFVNTKSTIGFVANSTLNKGDDLSTGPMSIKSKVSNTIDKILYSDALSNGKNNNYTLNGNYKFQDSIGRELNVDLDYGRYDNNTHQLISNEYLKPQASIPLNSNKYTIDAPTIIDIYSIKTDYQHPFRKGVLGYGFKLSWVNTDNFFGKSNQGNSSNFVKETENNFVYNENINAGYVNYNKQYKGFSLQAGLRVEHTNSKGHSNGTTWVGNQGVPFDSVISKGYTDFFPSAAITLNKNPMKMWSFTYSRRIDRPTYSSLNPFELKLNDYTSQRGNTELSPQYTNSFGVSYTYKYKLNLTANYSHVKDMFSQIFDVEGSKLIQTTKNLAKQDVISLNISYPYSYKNFSLFSNLSTNYSMYKAHFGASNRNINLNVIAGQLFTQSTLRFAKTWTAELSTLYLSPFVWAGTIKGKSLGFVDAGLQKQIFKGKGTIKASASDIFKTMHFRGTSDFGGQYSKVVAGWEASQFKLNLTYRFGSNQIKNNRQRKSGLEAEKNRTGGGGGIGQ